MKSITHQSLNALVVYDHELDSGAEFEMRFLVAAVASLAFVLGVECSTLTSSSSGCCVGPAVVVVSR